MTAVILESLESTARFGRLLGALSRPGDVICLEGDLGAGKTTLTASIAAGAGIAAEEYVTSPSFSLMHEYGGAVSIYHMDFYRLHSSDDVLALGLEEYLYGTGISIIEWPRRAQDIIPAENLLVELAILDDCRRRASCSSISADWQKRLLLLRQRYQHGP